MKKRLALGVGLAGLLVLSPGPANAITDGEEDFQHTYSGAVVAVLPELGFPDPVAYCSGTLVAPTVFVTVAHCLNEPDLVDGFMGVTFDQDVADGVDRLVPIERVVPHPAYGITIGRQADIGVVVLAEPVTDVGFATLPTLGQFDGIKPGPRSTFTKVGYGITLYQGSQFTDNNARHMATAHLLIAYVGSGYGLWELSGAKGTGGGTCFGDSGGAVLWQSSDILAAVHSAGFKQCVHHGIEVRLDTPLAQEFLAPFL
jgi:Trypsin